MEMVILVDQEDKAIGTMEKMEAHRKGELHRAFSVLIFNSKGEILLQKRAAQKYHSGGLWTNACCSHPLMGEKMEDAARRRLQEEMGIDVQPVFSYKFIYKTNLDRNLIEHEYDHVFIGTFDGDPDVNKNEVDEWKYVSVSWLKTDMQQHPDAYTYWFKLIVKHPALNF
jgi:isopentenyl-diphosphate delta-isomerase